MLLAPDLARPGLPYYELTTVTGTQMAGYSYSSVRRCAGFTFNEPCTDNNSPCYSCVDPSPTFDYGAKSWRL